MKLPHPPKRRVLVLLGLGVALAAFADADSNALAIDTVWILFAAVLVFLMQAGFAMLETGLTRAKNAANILMKNLMDFSIGSLVFWAIGYALMFGASKAGLFGFSGFFLGGTSAADAGGADTASTFAFWLFQAMFAATAATIVSGSMAERTRFPAYMVYSVFVTALIYPIVGHWIWGGGWLSNLGPGFADFAGSTVVHSTGGWLGLVGAMVLGPRIGKYVKNGAGLTARAIPGHSLPLASLGVFILWFGWFGFNAGSTVAGTDLSIALIALNTNVAAAAGAVGALFTAWIWFRKPDPTFALNGAIAGLVSITAGCAYVAPAMAVLIGLLGGVLVVLSVELLDKVCKIDDPIGAVSAHGVCGAWGTLAVGLFANEAIGGVSGLFFGGGLAQLGVQFVGVVAVFAWTMAAGFVLFSVIKAVMGLRVSREDELRGLDIGEHGAEAYSGFQIFSSQ